MPHCPLLRQAQHEVANQAPSHRRMSSLAGWGNPHFGGCRMAANPGPRPGPLSMATGTKAMCRSWARASRRVAGTRCSTARAPSRASRRTSTCIARGSTAPPRTMLLEPAGPTGNLDRPCQGRLERFERGRGAISPSVLLGRERGVFPRSCRVPESTRWCLRSTKRRCQAAAGHFDHPVAVPQATPESAPVDAKAGCLYPNNARAMTEAHSARLRQLRVLRSAGQCRRTRHRQFFMAKDGGCSRRRRTAPSSTASPGSASSSSCATTASRWWKKSCAMAISRQPTKFSPPAISKVQPVTKIDERSLQPGPLTARRASSIGRSRTLNFICPETSPGAFPGTP